jgi:uncharacterized membrane protein (DUF106 family)
MTSIISIIPISTLLIMAIAIAVSFINMTINRLLVTRLVGWEQYRSMQREISEYRSQTMKAMRAKDQKLLEKLKRKESQINSMQMKISKPQLYLFPISMSYIVIWFFFLTPTYAAVPTVAYLPGIGSISYVIWYFICSLMFGTLASRVIGVNPLQ